MIEQEDGEEKALYAKIYDYISRCIGDVSEHDVRDVVEGLDSRGYLVHGIKDESDYQSVKESGIKPLTPEDIQDGEGKGTGTSFWTSGVRVFHSETGFFRLVYLRHHLFSLGACKKFKT